MTPARVHRPFDEKKSQHSVNVRIWRSMRMLRAFTYGDLVVTAEATRRYLSNYVCSLHRAGYLRRSKLTKETRRRGPRSVGWTLIRDTGPRPPMCRRDGTVFDANEERVYGEAVYAPRKVRCDRDCRSATWAAIRKLQTFTVDELAEASGVKRQSLGRYLWSLERTGFLTKKPGQWSHLPRASGPRKLTADLYTLVRDCGEQAPAVRRDNVVHDPNSDLYYEPTVRVARAEAANG